MAFDNGKINSKKRTISIIMPVYNAEEYLDESIGSVLDQTYKNFRLICVDDGSTDSSWDILQKYVKADNRIKVFQQENKGQTLARLLSVKNSCSEWIAFIDGDDAWDACFLEKHIEEAQHTSADIVISGAYYHYKIRSSSKTEHKEKYYYENVSYLYLNLKREMERLGFPIYWVSCRERRV